MIDFNCNIILIYILVNITTKKLTDNIIKRIVILLGFFFWLHSLQNFLLWRKLRLQYFLLGDKFAFSNLYCFDIVVFVYLFFNIEV